MNQYTRERVNGYIRAEGRNIVNEAGEIVVLRGWGAGNWMNPEGFMVSGIEGMHGFTPLDDKFHYNIRYDRGRTMNDAIRELCGSEYTKKFWPQWYRNQLGEADIKAMADLGYNSVRLPLDAWGLLEEEPGVHFKEDSFAMLDDVIGWCEQYRIYAILDLHAAPGGQSGVSCDNGLDNVPHMFLEKESRERTILLWEELARRYADRWIVAGYELLNEPISTPKWLHLRPKLRSFYEETIERIRRIDKKHMIFLQGSSFAHDMEIFDEGYDPECNNWCITVHMYHFVAEKRTVYKYLEPSIRLNVPVWIGEGGAKNECMAIFYDMLGDMGIGFNLWTWKSIQVEESINGALIFPQPKRWSEIKNYIAEGGARPSYQEAHEIFDELLELCKYEYCTPNPEVHRYCQRTQGITLPAIGYDSYGGRGISFSSGWEYGNSYAYRTEDETKLVVRPEGKLPSLVMGPFNKENPEDELWLELGEGGFANYSIYRVEKPCTVTLQAMGVTSAVLTARCGELETTIEIAVSKEAVDYQIFTLPCEERHTVRLAVTIGIVQLASVVFSL